MPSVAEAPVISPRQRVENVKPRQAKADLHSVEKRDLTLDEAKALAGEIVADVLHDTDSQLKEFGDKSQVARWKRGEENPNLAKLIQRVDARKAMVKALLKTVPRARARWVVEIKEEAS